jgi:predicted nucleotidyltransferase
MKTLDRIHLDVHERAVIREVAARLKRDLPVGRVVLFGSKARGTAGRDSDIDLLVLTACPVTSDLRRQISEIVFEAGLAGDLTITSVVASEQEWQTGLLRLLPIRGEVDRDGAEV